uniref:ORF504 n=2 Tax=Leptospirillum ferrooxidans TaxID=180 RepID=Q58KB9_9BACT|nr:ORF504 [Leptospirillum ferrooxidans]
MAIYHMSVKTVSRSSGRSATGASAYRSAAKIVDQRLGLVHDYSRKKGVEYCEIVIPSGAPETLLERSVLWNAAEASEGRKNSVVAREFEVALPDELSPSERIDLVRELAQSIVDKHLVGVDFAIHSPGKDGDQRNHHAHILCTTRRLWTGGFGEKTRELDEKKNKEVPYWRKKWEELENRALERAGVKERVSCGSLEDQGLEHEPGFHHGPAITGILRRGDASHVLQRIDEEASKRLEGARLEGLEVFRSMEREIGSLEGQIEGLYREREAQDVAALTAAEQERHKTIKEILFCSAPEKNSGLTERREHLEQKYSMTAELRRNIEKQGAEDYMDGLATSWPKWATHIQKNGGLPACIEQLTRVLDGERKKWFKDKDLLSSTTKRLSLLEGFLEGRAKAMGAAVEKRQEELAGELARIRSHWAEASGEWEKQHSAILLRAALAQEEEESRQRAAGPVLGTLAAHGVSYRLRRDLKGPFSGAVLALDERHVYVGRRSNGEMIGIPH